VQFLENSPNPSIEIGLTGVAVGLTSDGCPHTSQTNVQTGLTDNGDSDLMKLRACLFGFLSF
jgi:hypothetical protein